MNILRSVGTSTARDIVWDAALHAAGVSTPSAGGQLGALKMSFSPDGDRAVVSILYNSLAGVCDARTAIYMVSLFDGSFRRIRNWPTTFQCGGPEPCASSDYACMAVWYMSVAWTPDSRRATLLFPVDPNATICEGCGVPSTFVIDVNVAGGERTTHFDGWVARDAAYTANGVLLHTREGVGFYGGSGVSDERDAYRLGLGAFPAVTWVNAPPSTVAWGNWGRSNLVARVPGGEAKAGGGPSRWASSFLAQLATFLRPAALARPPRVHV